MIVDSCLRIILLILVYLLRSSSSTTQGDKFRTPNVLSTPFEFSQSCPDGWYKVPEMSADDPNGRNVCLRGYPLPSTWDQALAKCRSDWGHLLILDDVFLKDLASPTLHAAIKIMSLLSMNSTWTGLYTSNYRLNWEYDTPIAASTYHATWDWDFDKPLFYDGCGKLQVNVTVPRKTFVAMHLHNCFTLSPFICFKWSRMIRPKSGKFCPDGWHGDLQLGVCLQYHSPEMPFKSAVTACAEKGAELATPKSGNLHNLTSMVAMLHSSSEVMPVKVTPPSPALPLTCFSCTNAPSEMECNEGNLKECDSEYDTCESLVQQSLGQMRYHKTCSNRERCAQVQENTIPHCKQGLECVQCCYSPGCNEHIFGEPQVWLGLHNVSAHWQWLDDGSPLGGFNRFIHTMPGTCASLVGRSFVWEAKDCSEGLSFICQQASLPVKEAVFTKHPQDLETTAAAIEAGSLSAVLFPGVSPDSGSSPVLTCEAVNVDPEMNVVWVKDGTYMNNGLPPGGFQMNLSVDASGKLPIFEAGALGLQGYYTCEVWGLEHHRRVSSKRALVHFTDVFTYQATVTITNVNLRGEAILGVLTSQFSIWPDQKQRNMFEDLFRLDNLITDVLPQTIIISKLSSGSTIADLTIYHRIREDKLAGLAGILLKLGLQSTPDYDSVEKTLLQLLRYTAASRLQQSLWKARWQDFTIPTESLSVRSTRGCTGFVETIDDVTYTWPDAKLGHLAHTLEICFSSGLPLANRTCEGDFLSGAEWSAPRFLQHCEELKESPVSQELKNISRIEVNETNVQAVAARVNELTKDSDALETLDIMLSSSILSKVVNLQKINNETSENFMSTVNNVLGATTAKIRDAQLMGQSSTRILNALTSFSQITDLGATNNTFQVQGNIAADIWGTSKTDSLPLGYGAVYTDEELNKETIQSYMDLDQVNISNVDAAIVLSPEVIQRIKDAQASRPSNITNMLGPIRLSYFIFRKGDLFLTPSALGAPVSLEQISKSRVVAGTVNNVVIKDLQQPVMTIFKPFKGIDGEPVCVYWDFAAAGGRGNWSSDGCRFNGTQDDRIICLCSHLTNFAILGSFDQSAIPKGHQLALSIISVIGLTLSIIGLTFTILTFLCFRRFRKGRGQKVLFNLAIALLAVNVIFLAGINATDDEIGCKVVAALIQYFLLVSFAWMMVEAVVQYFKFVKVLDTYVDCFMLKASIPAWGIPTVPVIAVACIDYNLFNGPSPYCWLDLPAFYFAFLLPVALVVIINSILFILVIKGITCDRPNIQSTRSKSDFRFLQVRAGVTCFIVLGLTWVFGFLAIADARLVFQYLFCICNAFQGFLIFIFYNIREKAVRDAWQQCFKTTAMNNKYESNTTDSTTPSKRPPRTYENLAFNGSK